MSPSSSTRQESASSSNSAWPSRSTFSTLENVAEAEHVAQFYETDPFLVACVSRFLRPPLRGGGGAVLIATPAHLVALERSLDLEELSVEVAGRRGQYVRLDAGRTADALLEGGVLDPKRFREIVGGHLAALASRWPRVRVFEEMTGLLWTAGKRDAAAALQQQWRSIARVHRFALLSAYPVADLEDDRSTSALVRMCSTNGRVLPPQRSSRVDWERLLRRRWTPAAEKRGRAYRRREPFDLVPAREKAVAVGSAPSTGRRRVLIVDDNEAVVETLSTALTILGNEVRSACDGLDALEVGSDFHPDVIFMDIGMPNMNGYDAARRIRQLPWGSDVTLVAITGWGQPEHRRRSGEAGFDEHLVKPVGVSQLRRLLEEPVVHD